MQILFSGKKTSKFQDDLTEVSAEPNSLFPACTASVFSPKIFLIGILTKKNTFSCNDDTQFSR